MLRFIVVLYMYVRCIKKTLFKIKIDLNNVIGKNTCDVNKATKITEENRTIIQSENICQIRLILT